MARTLVTVGTDGFTDWVQLTNGSKLSLGPVSVLSFVTKLCPDGRKVKQALEGFLRNQTAMVQVDEDQMWSMLTPRRARWATDSFMAQDQRTTPTSRRGKTMSNIDKDLAVIEKHCLALTKAAKAGTSPEKMTEGFGILAKLASKIQGKEANYFGFGESESETPSVEPSVPSELTYDVYAANNQLAEQIIGQAEETAGKIDQLVEAGRPFNADRAKADIHAVTSKVAGILKATDLTPPWVAADLKRLAARSQQLHDLFAPAKV